MTAMDAQARTEKRSLTDTERNEWESLMREANDLKKDIESEELRSGQLDGINDFMNQNQRSGIPQGEGMRRGNSEGDNELDEYNTGKNWRSAGHFLRDLTIGRTENMRTASTQDGALGGFLIPTTYMSNVFSLSPQGAIVRPRATIMPSDPNSPDAGVSMPKIDHTAKDGSALYGGVKVNWTGEGVAHQKTETKLQMLDLLPQEVGAEIDATNKLLRNSPQSASTYMTLLERALVAAMDMAYLTGSGVKKPMGVINSGAALKVKRLVAGTVEFSDLAEMLAHILISGAGLDNYVWVASQSLLKDIITMKDDAGNLIYISGDPTKGIVSSLLGMPILWTGKVGVKGSTGDIGLYDFNYYSIKDGYGPAIATSPHVKFSQQITVIQAVANTDGKPILDAPVILEDGDTKVSPFIVLDKTTV